MVEKEKTNAASGDELSDLLTKLYGIQEDLGAKPRTSEDEKKRKAENVATMGSTKKAQKKGSRFLDLKSTILDRLKTIQGLMRETKEKEAAGMGGDNAKDIIKMQAEIREQIRQAGDEWAEMDEIYKKEARKKKSKFTSEELEVQSELVRRLGEEIDKIKELQMRGYARGRDAGKAVSLNTKAFYADGPVLGSGKKKEWSGTGGGVSLTSGQKQQIQVLEERDAEFDRQLDEIGEGIQDLAEIAAMQGEEVKRQNVMLDSVNNKLDKVNERMMGVNGRMKETLETVGRAKDKLCVDIMCIILMIGFGAVIYSLVKG